MKSLVIFLGNSGLQRNNYGEKNEPKGNKL